MQQYDFSPYAIFLFAQFLLILANVKGLTATARCAGELLSPVGSDSPHTSYYSWQTTLYNDRVILVVVPDCLTQSMMYRAPSTLTPINLTYIISELPTDGYFIISGNITGSGMVEISDDYKITVYRSTQSKNFVYHATKGLKTVSQLRINYKTDNWQRGDGPYIGVFYASTTHSSTIVPRGAVRCDLNAMSCGDTALRECFIPSQACNGFPDCSNGADESVYCLPAYSRTDCSESWRKCSVTSSHEYICLPEQWRCNGRDECLGGIDESDCNGCCKQQDSASVCYSPENCRCELYELYSDYRYKQVIGGCNGKYQTFTIRNNEIVDWPSHPFWPMIIPYNITYIWLQTELLTADAIVIKFHSVVVSQGDTVMLHIGARLYNLSTMSSGMMKSVPLEGEVALLNIVMMSPYSVYNFSYTLTADRAPQPSTTEQTLQRGAAACDDVYVRSCLYNDLCFRKDQLCNNHMDCPNGKDEEGCGTFDRACAKDEIMCIGEDEKVSCFNMHERCDGSEECSNGYDEKDCDSTLCGTHNGTFLCSDNSCIFETWLCDKTKDCPDGADEQTCDVTSLKVVTASVIGSLVCAIMIVIAVGCSCKLRTQRMYETLHHRSRYESPMTRITNELMRRTAPPPYAEAMQRSRPFEEVRSEYLAALELRQRDEETDDTEVIHEEQRSVASASGTIDDMEGSLVEVGEENVVSFRRNPNKPQETNQSGRDVNSRPNVNLEPKSDDETTDDRNTPLLLVQDETQISISQSNRQELRRASIDSDVSILSRDSEDVALLRLH